MKLSSTKKDAVVISDLHLGNPYTCNSDIWDVLNSKFKLLIVVGDILDYKHVDEIGKDEKKILRRMEQMELEGKLIAISGNHEEYVRNIHTITSLHFRDEYSWEVEGYKFLATHGHKFCSIWSKRGMRRSLLEHARKHNYNVVFCGHNHLSDLEKEDGVIYCNTGSMLGMLNSAAVMTPALKVRLVTITPYKSVGFGKHFGNHWYNTDWSSDRFPTSDFQEYHYSDESRRYEPSEESHNFDSLSDSKPVTDPKMTRQLDKARLTPFKSSLPPRKLGVPARWRN